MANTSILAAFERMWQHVVAVVGSKSDLDHTHDDIYYTETEIDTKLSGKADTHDHPYLSNSTTYAGSSSVGGAANSANKVNLTRPSNVLTAVGDMAVLTEQIFFLGSDGLTNGAPVNYCIINAKKGSNHRTILDCYALNTGDHYINGCMNANNGSTASDANVWTGWVLQPNQTSLDTTLQSAKSYTDTEVAKKANSTHNHDSAYDAKGSADIALSSAKSYTDTKTSGLVSTSTVDTKISTHNTSTSAHSDIRDLITGLTNRLNALADSDDTTLDQMSEIVEYIKANKSLIDSITTSKINVSDIVNNLTTNITNKPLSAAQGVAIKALIDALQTELDSHTHAIADVSGLQSALDGKAASSHGTHVSFDSTNKPKMDGTAAFGTSTKVARADHVHPTDTSRASQADLDALETVVAGKVDSLSDLGITATATELNYVDGVTSNIQTQLDGKASSSHTHNYAGSSSAGGAATSANKVNSSLTVKLNGGTTEGTNMFTFNGSAAKAVNITPSAIGAAASSHTHDDRYYTETEIDSKISTINTAINGKAASSHTHDASDISGTFAGTATYAVSAGSSSKATSATSATYATTATKAGSASKATSATSATYATTATKAGTATYASNSRTYVGATTAASGTTGFVPAATTATRLKFLRGDGTWADVSNASTATYATSAGSSSKATSATSATYASTATKAGTATYSTNAGTASYSSNGAKATSATSATYASTATKAGTATYATNAGTASYSSNGAKATSATSATYATTATNSGTATKVTGTLTNPSSATFYPIAFHSGISTGAKALCNNDGLRYQTREGTTSQNGFGVLTLGNSTASGTAGNKYGEIHIYSKTANRGKIQQQDVSSDVTHKLPTTSGTLLNNNDFTVSNGVLTLNFL